VREVCVARRRRTRADQRSRGQLSLTAKPLTAEDDPAAAPRHRRREPAGPPDRRRAPWRTTDGRARVSRPAHALRFAPRHRSGFRVDGRLVDFRDPQSRFSTRARARVRVRVRVRVRARRARTQPQHRTDSDSSHSPDPPRSRTAEASITTSSRPFAGRAPEGASPDGRRSQRDAVCAATPDSAAIRRLRAQRASRRAARRARRRGRLRAARRARRRHCRGRSTASRRPSTWRSSPSRGSRSDRIP
jgi:hypothetical protein